MPVIGNTGNSSRRRRSVRNWRGGGIIVIFITITPFTIATTTSGCPIISFRSIIFRTIYDCREDESLNYKQSILPPEVLLISSLLSIIGAFFAEGRVEVSAGHS